MRKTFLFSGLIALFVTTTTLGVFYFFQKENGKTFKIEHVNSTPAKQAVYTLDDNGEMIPLDFTKTADKVMDAVVHIKSTQAYTAQNPGYREQADPFERFFENDPFRDFFNPRVFPKNQSPKDQYMPPRIGQGSGVVISDDGYIITNNHVIANADDLEVTLHDNRTYKAMVIGADPTTDLALIQIKETGLTTVPFVNSDDVKVGEWVLAVGNPFNLTSTVTAGIVSAKARNINILKEQFAVESFIQTDAAINPGNSGGALVNLEGGLVGINTAIASPTGAYSGYGFAIPANIVSKVVEDLMKFGVVQRGVLGVMIRTVDGNLKNEKDLSVSNGVYVDSLLEMSAAAAAGIQVGDVILEIDGKPIERSPELQEIIARHRPGDKLTIVVDRKGKEKDFDVVLNNRKGNTAFTKKEHREVLSILGAELETLDAKSSEKLNIEGGVKVTNIFAGKLRSQTNMKSGFIITKLDGKNITNAEDLVSALENKRGGVMLEGIYEDLPGQYYYAFGMQS